MEDGGEQRGFGFGLGLGIGLGLGLGIGLGAGLGLGIGLGVGSAGLLRHREERGVVAAVRTHPGKG